MDDLSQSCLDDLRRATQGDEELLEQILSSKISAREKNARLEEAQAIFPDLSKQVIEEALQASQWDVDLAIVALIAKSEEQAQNARVSREEEKRQRYINVEQMAMARLRGYLTADSKIRLQELLEKNEGDIDETITEFFRYIEATQKEEAEQEENNRRQTLIHAVQEFAPENISRDEVVQALEKSNWDSNEAARTILKISEQRKIQQIAAMCKHANVTFPAERYEIALAENGWDVFAAREALLRVPEDSKIVPEEPQPMEDFLARSMRFITKIDTQVTEESRNGQQQIVKENLDRILRNDPSAIGLVGLPGAVPAVGPVISRQPPPVELENSAKLSTIENSRLNEDRPMLESEIATSTEAEDRYDVNLTLSSDLLDNSAILSVNWAFNESAQSTGLVPSNRDWIGLYKDDQKDHRSYLTYQWVVPGTNSVEFSLRRFEYGTYNCRYHSAASKTCLSVSKSFSIGPVFTLTPILDVSSNQVVLKIEQKSGDPPASGAWVGLYHLDPTQESPRNQNYVTYQRLSSSKDNTLIFEPPKTGVWEFRLFPLNTYQHAAVNHIDISGSDTLSLRLESSLPVPQIFIDVDLQTKDVTTDAPWIGVYKTCEVNPRMYRRYKYLSTGGKSSIQFKAPIHSGAYEARLFANGSYDVIAKSNPISLEGI